MYIKTIQNEHLKIKGKNASSAYEMRFIVDIASPQE